MMTQAVSKARKKINFLHIFYFVFMFIKNSIYCSNDSNVKFGIKRFIAFLNSRWSRILVSLRLKILPTPSIIVSSLYSYVCRPRYIN